MEGVPQLFKEGAPNPQTGGMAQHELENIRLHTPGNYGPPQAPYPCHHQIISSGNPRVDCPKGWPQAFVQFVFPSFDRTSFVANQGSMHDPLSQLSIKGKVGQYLEMIQEVEPSRLRNYQYFKKVRNEFVETLYFRVFLEEDGKGPEEETPLEKFGVIAKGSKLTDFYKEFTQKDFESPELFFMAFASEEGRLASLFPRPDWKNPQAKRELTRPEIRAINGNYGRFMRRSVTENFVNTLLGTLLLSIEKPEYHVLVQNAFYLYFVLKNDSRKDILELLRHAPKLARETREAPSTKEVPESLEVPLDAPAQSLLNDRAAAEAWSERSYEKKHYDEWKSQLSASSRTIDNTNKVTQVLFNNPDLFERYYHAWKTSPSSLLSTYLDDARNDSNSLFCSFFSHLKCRVKFSRVKREADRQFHWIRYQYWKLDPDSIIPFPFLEDYKAAREKENLLYQDSKLEYREIALWDELFRQLKRHEEIFQYFDENREFFRKTGLVSQPEFLGFLSQASEHLAGNAPFMTPYGKARVQLKNGEEVVHSDCGEHITGYLIGAGLYNPETGVYDAELWKEKVDFFELRPHTRYPNDRYGPIFRYFSGPDNKGRKAKYDSRQFSHDEWGSEVMAYLNEPSLNGDGPGDRDGVLYSKPPKLAVCEMNPGIDNTLRMFELLLGDFVDDKTYGAIEYKADRGGISLRTLSIDEALKLEQSPEKIEEIKATYRRWKFIRVFRIISRHSDQPIGWSTLNRMQKLQDDFGTLILKLPGVKGDYHWGIHKGHFVLTKPAGQTDEWKFLHSRWIVKEILRDGVFRPSSLSNLHQFFSLDNLPSDPEVLDAFRKNPELVYSLPLQSDENRMKIAAWIFKNRIKELYSRVEDWIKSLGSSGM